MARKKNEVAEEGDNQVIDAKAVKALFKEGEGINQDMANCRADMKGLVVRAEDIGLNRKDFKQALKEHCKQRNMTDADRELRAGVNLLLVAAGDAPLFAWGEDQREAA